MWQSQPTAATHTLALHAVPRSVGEGGGGEGLVGVAAGIRQVSGWTRRWLCCM